MSNNNKVVAIKPVDKLKAVMQAPSVQAQFQNALKDKSDLFVASLIDLYSGDDYLQNCDPSLVVMEALKAATLNLPINKSLGFAYIVPYKGKPQFQIGYRGLVQLAMRSGVYKYINADKVYEGEYQGYDKLTGDLDLKGEKTSTTVVGYFAYMETVNGFRKTMYMSKEDMEAHAKKYSAPYKAGKNTPWKSDFDAMGIKTMLRGLLGKYGLMTVEMADGMAVVEDSETSYQENANSECIDIPPEGETVDSRSGEIIDIDPEKALPVDDDAPSLEEVARMEAEQEYQNGRAF